MPMKPKKKRLFKHGGSMAINLPKSFVENVDDSSEVIIEQDGTTLKISPVSEFDTIENEPEFKSFIEAIAKDALDNPEKLKDSKDVWDDEWTSLLKGISTDNE
jgi:virulence-associated protein VagC